ncbi:MAG: flagellar export chaperone FliS [Gammaproteobacteria bacterium]
MNQMYARSALQEYQQVSRKAGVEDASPHRLIQMLMEGALEKIAAAKGFMARGSIQEKGAHISWAVSIIDGLRVSLDKSVGGEIAENLEELYIYMMRRLTEANLKNEPAYLDEVASLLGQIKSAWDAIAPEAARMEEEKQHAAIPQGR